MSKHVKFNLKTITDLQTELNSLSLSLPIEKDLSILAEPVKVGNLTAPNRMAIHPMEGFDAEQNGAPGELSFRRYKRYAEGGSGLIWFEATSVLHESRTNPRQFWINDDSVDAYTKLVTATREAAEKRHGRQPVILLQITHSGRYSKPDGVPKPLVSHRNPILDPHSKIDENYPLLTDDYLDRLQDTFVAAAKLAKQAGFDGIDVKSCHRYLFSELLAGFERDGKYGGSYENRTRMLRETLSRIRDEVDGIFISTRINAYDALPYPYGWGVNKNDQTIADTTEPVQLVKDLRNIGVPLINMTIGNPYFNPHYNRPYERPLIGFNLPDEPPLLGVYRIIDICRTLQEAVPDIPVIGAGYGWLRHLMPYVAAGIVKNGWAQMIGQGRNAFAYPDSVNDIIEKGSLDPDKCCITCSACTEIMRNYEKTGCVIRDRETYGECYKVACEKARSKLK